MKEKKTKPKWGTLTRSKKALPRVWDSLTPELRRKLFVGNTFTSFKLWKKLAPKEVKLIQEKLHYKKDVEKICKSLQKFLAQQEKQNQSIEENNMSNKTKKSEASDASSKSTKSKSTKKVSKPVAKKSKTVKKVVPIVDALKADCPKCKVHKGHRCVHTNSNKGKKRDTPHRARVQKALKSSKKKAA